MEEIIWDKVKSEFIAGGTLKSLSEKYSVPFSTVKSRHTRENWSELRKKTAGKIQEKITTEIATQQAQGTLNAIQVIDTTIEDLIESLPQAIISSKEGVARAIGDLLKIRGTYTGETSDKNKGESGVSVDLIYKIVLDSIYKPASIEGTKVSLPPKSY